jgi:protein-histidine N-methyltransferase
LKLGCGSALPTAMLFAHALRDKRSWKFVLQDYNDIFSLVTVPNLFLTWYAVRHTIDPSGEIEVTQQLKEQFLAEVGELGIEFRFIVGPWGISLTVSPNLFR